METLWSARKMFRIFKWIYQVGTGVMIESGQIEESGWHTFTGYAVGEKSDTGMGPYNS